MAYSAINRIIHKYNKNVNPLARFLWEYFTCLGSEIPKGLV